ISGKSLALGLLLIKIVEAGLMDRRQRLGQIFFVLLLHDFKRLALTAEDQRLDGSLRRVSQGAQRRLLRADEAPPAVGSQEAFNDDAGEQPGGGRLALFVAGAELADELLPAVQLLGVELEAEVEPLGGAAVDETLGDRNQDPSRFTGRIIVLFVGRDADHAN